MRLRSVHFVVLLVAVTIVAGGCGFFGSSPTQSSANNHAEKMEIESMIDTLIEIGLNPEGQDITRFVTSSVLLSILDDSDDGVVQSLESGFEVVDELQSILEDSTITNIEIGIGDITLYNGRAEIVGPFEIDLINAEGQHVECVGYATAHLVKNDGIWQFSTVTIEDAECFIDGEEPGEGDDKDDETGEPGDPVDPVDPVDPTDPSDNDVPNVVLPMCHYLYEGVDHGEDQTKAIQHALNHLGYNAGLVDGDYGPITAAAVKEFQRDAGILVDGEFGPETQRALNDVLRERGGAFECDTIESKPTNTTKLTMKALRKGTAFETPVYQYDGQLPGPTIVFVGCIHGNERSGHLTLVDAIDKGISIDRGRLILVPAINKIACEQNRRTLSRSTSLLSGKDFNRFFPVGSSLTYTIAKEMWSILTSEPNLAFVVDFHDGFINSLGNTLIHTRQTKAQSVARKVRDSLNRIRPAGARGPSWRAFTEPISGSLIRKVGRDLGVPGILVELSGRNPGDPLSLRKTYAERIIKMIGEEFGMRIDF